MTDAASRVGRLARYAAERQLITASMVSVVVSELSLGLPAVGAIGPLLPNGYAVVDGRLLPDDQWDGYPAERARVTRRMRDRGASGGATVVVSGDVHSSWAFEGPTDPDVGGDAPAVTAKPRRSDDGDRRTPPSVAMRLMRGESSVRRVNRPGWSSSPVG